MKKYIPGAANQKLSKVNIITRASNYIQHLANLLNLPLDENNSTEKCANEETKKSANEKINNSVDFSDKNKENDSGYNSVIKIENTGMASSTKMPLSPAYSEYSNNSDSVINTPLKNNVNHQNLPSPLYYHNNYLNYYQNSHYAAYQPHHSTPLQSKYFSPVYPKIEHPQQFSPYSPAAYSIQHQNIAAHSPFMPSCQKIEQPSPDSTNISEDDELLEAIAEWQNGQQHC